MRKPMYELRYRFVRYEKNVKEAVYIYDAEKLPLNILYAADKTGEKVKFSTNCFLKLLKRIKIPLKRIKVPLKRIKVTRPPPP